MNEEETVKYNNYRKIFAILMTALISLALASCGAMQTPTGDNSEKKHDGDIMVLFTSDIHCGVEQGFGLAGLQNIREKLEKEGYTTILVDDGDAIQGELIGGLSRGENMIELMNEMKYDVVIPGNHEFDYGMEQFLSLTEKANFLYISCNFNKGGELVFEPYIIKEAAGKKIAFVGVTTPTTLASSTPKAFCDENGEYIYGFLQDESGEGVYNAVQKAVDDARAEGADYVYVLGHLGLYSYLYPWTYADVIEHTNGFDVFLDGHSHDTEQVVMKNKDGKDVVRSSCGTKLNAIGYSEISKDKGIVDTNIWTWDNKVCAADLLGIENNITKKIDEVNKSIEEITGKEIATSDVDLTINDPEEKDNNGKPIRVIRMAETNLSDLISDAIRIRTDADIGLINGGGIRVGIDKGSITYGDVVNVMPFNNAVCIVEATGQQIIDALEWGVHGMPGEFGGFLHCSGMTYEVNSQIPSSCTTDNEELFAEVTGERRVSNVKVGGEPIDPKKTYTVAGIDYPLLNHGDGQTAFNGAKVISENFDTDCQVLIDYIIEDLGGEIGTEYADPYGSGRVVIK